MNLHVHVILGIIYIGQVFGNDNTKVTMQQLTPKTILVKEGDSTNLSCESSDPWFLCLWSRVLLKIKKSSDLFSRALMTFHYA